MKLFEVNSFELHSLDPIWAQRLFDYGNLETRTEAATEHWGTVLKGRI